jgi:hypothetical protein
MDIRGNTPSVVLYTHGIVGMYDHIDVPAISCQGLINGIIHDLVHEVMETLHADVPDVHGRALSHRFQTFQYLDTVGTVSVH